MTRSVLQYDEDADDLERILLSSKHPQPDAAGPLSLSCPSLQHLPVWVINAEAETLGSNHAANEGFKGTSLQRLFEDPSAFKALVSTDFEVLPNRPFRLADGRRCFLSVERDEWEGKKVYVVALFDVTHHQFLAEESELSKRLSAVSNLAAGVAYEISDPLTVLLGRLEFLEMLDNVEPDTLQKHLDIMKKHAGRIATTVRNLQVFAHPALGARGSVSLLSVLQRSAEVSRTRLGRGQIVLGRHGSYSIQKSCGPPTCIWSMGN